MFTSFASHKLCPCQGLRQVCTKTSAQALLISIIWPGAFDAQKSTEIRYISPLKSRAHMAPNPVHDAPDVHEVHEV